jgi:signal transduction histidine kinase
MLKRENFQPIETLFFLLLCFICAKPCAYAQNPTNIEEAEKFIHDYSPVGNIKDSVLVNCQNYLAFSFRDSDLSKAEKYANDAKNLSEKIAFGSGLSRSIGYLGMLAYRQGKYNFAVEYHLKSLDIALDLGLTQLAGFRYNDLANVHIDKGDFERAKIFNQQSLNIKRKQNDLEGIATSYRNFGMIFLRQGEYDSADFYLNNAEEIAKEIRNDRILAYVLTYKGEMQIRLNQANSAIPILKDAVRMQEKVNNQYGLGESLNALGDACLSARRIDEALTYYTRAAQLASKNKIKLEVERAYLGLSKCNQELGNTAAAFDFFKRYTSIKDSLFSEKNEEFIAFTEAKFQNEKNEIEIERLKNEQKIHESELRYERLINQIFIIVVAFGFILLAFVAYGFFQKRKINRLLIRQKKIIESEKAEKAAQAEILKQLNENQNRLLAIIGHDLRSPINSLQGMLMLLNHNALSNEEFVMLTKSLHGDVGNLHLMLNNLLAWVYEQREGINPKPVNFPLLKAADENIALYREIAVQKNIEISNEVPAEVSVHADIDQIKLVIRNLMSNALKFTPKGGKITLSAKENEKNVLFCVQDTGIGIPTEKAKSLFSGNVQSTQGTENEKGTGLGLALCKDFVEINGGEIFAESEEGKGSRFCFSLPKALK